MSETKVNTEGLRMQYPFLEKIWAHYDEFNQAVEHSDPHKYYYHAICEQVMKKVQNNEKWNNDICIKLIRNLRNFPSIRNTDKYNSERCNNLNSWLYYITKNYDVHQNSIMKIFDVYKDKMEIVGHGTPYCSKYLYKDIYKNSDEIIKLINLKEYENDILSILMNNNHNNHRLCLKFIFECANKYKKMNKIYCTNQTINSSEKSYICSELLKFMRLFTSYISTKEELIEKLPSLDAEESEKFPICSSDTGKKGVKLEKKQNYITVEFINLVLLEKL
ncbi:hypothetical protein PCYB_007500, partial [Plasmodium cynomolgi strain B]